MQNYNYNRALYESIINEVARIVKKRLNESRLNESFKFKYDENEYFDIETAIKYLKEGKRIYIPKAQASCHIINNKIYIVYRTSEKRPSITFKQFREWYGPDNEYKINYKFRLNDTKLIAASVYNEEENINVLFNLIGKDYNNALKYFSVFALATIDSSEGIYLELKIKKDVLNEYKEYRKKLTDEEEKELFDLVDELYSFAFKNTNSTKDVLNKTSKFMEKHNIRFIYQI